LLTAAQAVANAVTLLGCHLAEAIAKLLPALR
jgi:hypothetical protein